MKNATRSLFAAIIATCLLTGCLPKQTLSPEAPLQPVINNEDPSAVIASQSGDNIEAYARDTDGTIEDGGIYAIFYSATKSILYHTGSGNTDQVTGTVSENILTLESKYPTDRQLWLIEKADNDGGYFLKNLDSNRYLDLSRTTSVNGHVATSEQPVRVDIMFHENNKTYSLHHESNYLTHGSTPGNKYYCSTEQSSSLIQFELYQLTEILPTIVGDSPKGTAAPEPFSSEATGAIHFRIPSLYTLSNGWLVAAADIRWAINTDSPENLDTIVSLSKDNGQTWNWEVVNYFADMTESATGDQSASFIDPSLVQDSSGTLHMIVDACPAYVGLMSGNQMGQESSGFDDSGRLLIAKATAGNPAPTSAESYTYYVDLNDTNNLSEKENDEDNSAALYPICSESGSVTDIYVDNFLNIYQKSSEENLFIKLYTEQLNNSRNRVQKNLFFLNSEWKVYPVFYIMHRTARVTSEGLEWNPPRFLDIKAAENEKFTGVCPGRGNKFMYNGKERILFPLYDNRTGTELASVIYSDDGGATWERGRHNSQISAVGKTSESQVVILPNGNLRMYSRNTIDYISYADSSDGGVSWGMGSADNNLYSRNQGGGCMVSFINLEGTLKGPNGQTYSNLLLGSYARIQRTEGIVRIGSVSDNGTVTWLNADETRYSGINGDFGYSCVSQLQKDGVPSDTFGILYESNFTPCEIVYDTVSVTDLLGAGWTLE